MDVVAIVDSRGAHGRRHGVVPSRNASPAWCVSGVSGRCRLTTSLHVRSSSRGTYSTQCAAAQSCSGAGSLARTRHYPPAFPSKRVQAVVHEHTHGLRVLSGAGRVGRQAEFVEVPLEAIRLGGTAEVVPVVRRGVVERDAHGRTSCMMSRGRQLHAA